MKKANDSVEEADGALNRSDLSLQQIYSSVYSWLIPMMCCILAVAFFSNTLILVSAKFLQRTPTLNLRLCISLAGADAWAALLMCGGLLINSYFPIVHGIFVDSYACWVLFFEMVRVAAMLTSGLHLFALALNHCYSIFAPLHYKVTVTGRVSKLCIVFLWFLPSAGMLIWFGAIPGQGFLDNCSPAFYVKLPFRLTVFLLLTIPLALTFLIYIYILRHLWLFGGSRRAGLPRSGGMQEKRKAVSTTFLIVGTFAFFWCPCVVYFVGVCQEGCPYTLQDLTPSTRLMWSGTVNSFVMIKLVINPLIYALRIPDIHYALWTMWKTRMGSTSLTPMEVPTRFQRLCSVTVIASQQRKSPVASRKNRNKSLTTSNNSSNEPTPLRHWRSEKRPRHSPITNSPSSLAGDHHHTRLLSVQEPLFRYSTSITSSPYSGTETRV